MIEITENWTKPDGTLHMFMPFIDTSKGQVHLFCPAGIGDVGWLWCKFKSLHDRLTEEGRELIWHFPKTPSDRIDPYARMVGMKVGNYISKMENFRDYPGEPTSEDFETGCAMYVHANVHIEQGLPLHEFSPRANEIGKTDFTYDFSHLWEPEALAKPQWDILREKVETFRSTGNVKDLTWCPWLPFTVPTPPIVETPGRFRSPGWGQREQVEKWTEPHEPYIVLKMGARGWMAQNWSPRTYAKVVQKLEEVAPVMIMGYSPCGEIGLIEQTVARCQNHGGFCIDQNYETALTAVVNCSAMVSIDDGMSIMATYLGKDVLRLYPDWLERMPGTWEDSRTLHPNNSWCLIEDLMGGVFDEWLNKVRV